MSDAALERLRAAVVAAPEDLELWIVFGTRLLQAGRAGEALDAARHVLVADPVGVSGLRLAAAAARDDGRADLAVSYRRLLAALGEGTGGPPASGAAPEASWTVIDAPIGVEATWSDTDDGTSWPADVDPELAASRDGFTKPTITLADVAGLEDVKRRIHAAFLLPLRNSQLQRTFGASLRGGLLLYGPPGCGKTFLAAALAGELGLRFVAIAITDVLDPYLGVSERNLHDRFELARRLSPCVVFIDEIDALGRKRSQQRNSAGRGVVNQLLAELDSIGADNTGVFVLSATNHPWDVDLALRRPGRFDRTLLVPPPDEPARAAIFADHLRDRPVDDVDYDALARRTKGYSGADIAYICSQSAAVALARSAANQAVSPITASDLTAATGDVHVSTSAWFETARNYVLYANDSGEYDELADYLRGIKLL